jgi:hypothetical protein
MSKCLSLFNINKKHLSLPSICSHFSLSHSLSLARSCINFLCRVSWFDKNHFSYFLVKFTPPSIKCCCCSLKRKVLRALHSRFHYLAADKRMQWTPIYYSIGIDAYLIKLYKSHSIHQKISLRLA